MDDIQHQLTHALAAHAQWKARLKSAIQSGRSEFTADSVARDDRCDFGKWLYTGISPATKLSPHYARCRELHAQFHAAAAEVLALAVAGRTAEAETKLGVGSPFAAASAAVTREIMDWQKEAAAAA